MWMSDDLKMFLSIPRSGFNKSGTLISFVPCNQGTRTQSKDPCAPTFNSMCHLNKYVKCECTSSYNTDTWRTLTVDIHIYVVKCVPENGQNACWHCNSRIDCDYPAPRDRVEISLFIQTDTSEQYSAPEATWLTGPRNKNKHTVADTLSILSWSQASSEHTQVHVHTRIRESSS